MDNIKRGLIITKVLIWNKVENSMGNECNVCKLTFNNGSTLKYECDFIEELEDENAGIYELQDDGTYIQIENWEN